MKTVYVVTYWTVGEDDGISGIFDTKQKAMQYVDLILVIQKRIKKYSKQIELFCR